MAMKRYRGVDGVARQVVKRYRGVDGVARAIVRGYRGVDGVARQYFASGAEWRKYSCDTTPTYWYATISSTVGNTAGPIKYGMVPGSTSPLYSGYEFSAESGYYGTGATRLHVSDWVGAYSVSDTEVIRYTNVTYDGSEGQYEYYQVTGVIVAAARQYSAPAYNKGPTEYGSVYSPEGELPEDGDLVRGSATDGYCVLNVNGTYYYYEKV